LLSTILALVLAQGVTYRSAADAAPSAFSLIEGANSAAVLDVRMTTCGTTPVVAKGGPLTVTRAATQNYVCADGVMRSAPANTLPITEQGGQIFGAGTNTILQSEDFSTTWTTSGVGVAAPTITTNQTNSPQGTLTADQLAYPAVSGANVSIVQQSFTATAVPWTGSGYVKGQSGSGTIFLSFGTTISAPCVFNTSTWTRCSVTGTLTAAAWLFKIGVDKTTTGNTDQGAQTVFLSDFQVEADSFAAPYQPTTTVPVAWTATSVSMSASIAIGSAWCATIRESLSDWSVTSAHMNLGAAQGVANSVYMNGGFFGIFDATATQKYYTLAMSGSGPKTLTLCSANGAMSASLNSVNVGSGPNGAGTGMSTWQQPIGVYIGENSSAGNQINGYVTRFTLCNTASASGCR
jgi:hypothetical protein